MAVKFRELSINQLFKYTASGRTYEKTNDRECVMFGDVNCKKLEIDNDTDVIIQASPHLSDFIVKPEKYKVPVSEIYCNN